MFSKYILLSIIIFNTYVLATDKLELNLSLIVAVKNGDIEKVESLLISELDLYFKDDSGKTALDWAIEKKHEKIVKVLRFMVMSTRERIKFLIKKDFVSSLKKS